MRKTFLIDHESWTFLPSSGSAEKLTFEAAFRRVIDSPSGRGLTSETVRLTLVTAYRRQTPVAIAGGRIVPPKGVFLDAPGRSAAA